MCITSKTSRAKNCCCFGYTSPKTAVNLFFLSTIKNKGSKQMTQTNYFTAGLQAFCTKDKQEICEA